MQRVEISTPFSASDGEIPLAHQMGEGGQRTGEGSLRSLCSFAA